MFGSFALPGAFFLSGAAGLIFQVVWLYRCGLVFGSSVAAVTVVLVAVLAVAVSIWYPAAVGWGIAWLAFGFSGIAFLNATVFVRVFRRYGAFPE